MVEVSDGFCALVGRPRAEILGKRADELGISDRTRLDWLIDRFPERGRSHRQRRVFETPEGPRLAELDIHGIELAGERMIVSVITPVPADEPHGDVEVLAAVLEAAPLGMVLFGPDLRIVRVNRAVERIGTIRPEHLGVPLLDAFPQVSPEIVAAVEGVFAVGEPVVGMESTGVDGRTYLLTMFPVRNAVDEVEQVGCLFLDVSDRVFAERALAVSEQRRREILATMLQAEEVERSRIATELHDDTVQVMTASLMALDRAALVATKAGIERLASALGLARATLEEATDRTRRLMFELRPAVLHDHGIVAAMRLLAGQIAQEVGATSEVTGPGGRYDLAVEELVYRSARRRSPTSASMHGQARSGFRSWSGTACSRARWPTTAADSTSTRCGRVPALPFTWGSTAWWSGCGRRAATSRSTASRVRERACGSSFPRSSRRSALERVGTAPPDVGGACTAYCGHVWGGPADYLYMSAERTPPPILAYETQARYGPGEAWITLDVSVSHALAVDEAFFCRDPWGRKPTEVRVRSIVQQPDAG